MTKILFYFFVFNNLLLLNITYPMSILILLIIQIIIINMMIGIMNKTFWFSYIMFIITISGLMILFIYLTTLTSNYINMMNFTKMLKFIIMMLLIMIIVIKIGNSNNFMNNLLNNLNLNKMNSDITLMKLYNNHLMIITLLMMNYIFLVLLVITKIINFKLGPIRSFN